MRYLHTMVRVSDLQASLDFYCNKLGLVEIRRMENQKGRFTLVFLATPDDAGRMEKAEAESPVIEADVPPGEATCVLPRYTR